VLLENTRGNVVAPYRKIIAIRLLPSCCPLVTQQAYNQARTLVSEDEKKERDMLRIKLVLCMGALLGFASLIRRYRWCHKPMSPFGRVDDSWQWDDL
jgi:hypothetical protein